MTNCSTRHKIILTHFGENFKFFDKITFHLKQFSTFSTETCLKSVSPPGSLDINPFDYLKCGISRRGINRSSHKKTVPDHHHHGGLQQHLQGGPQEGLQPLPIQARGGLCR